GGYGFGNPAYAADRHVLVWNQTRLTERHPSGEIGATADAGNPDDPTFEVLHGIDLGSAVHRKQKLIDEVGDQYSVRSSQDRGRNRAAGDALGELDRATDQRLNSPSPRENVADIHAIFLE